MGLIVNDFYPANGRIHTGTEMLIIQPWSHSQYLKMDATARLDLGCHKRPIQGIR